MPQPGAVAASGHPAVSSAAVELMRQGGNAFDGVVAAGFASGVAEPALTSLGGGGFLLARPRAGEPVVYDFFVDTPGRGRAEPSEEPHFVPVVVRFPASEQTFNAGHGSVAVPGMLAGLVHAHARRGRLPLAEVLRPAIRLAREGVPLNAHQAYFIRLLRPIMTMTPEGRALFAPQGELLREGERLTNPDLAEFLESLPDDGAKAFYSGAIAERIDGDLRAKGLLTAEDLASYRVVERVPLAFDYRGHGLLTNPPPSQGGSLLALSLALLAETPLPRGGAASAEALCTLTRAMQEVDALRAAGCVGPEAIPGDEQLRIGLKLRSFTRGTTHVSVCDDEGNAASMTSSNGECSGYVVPGTGVMLNNMLGEDDLHPEGFFVGPPGERVASMMSPTLLLRGDEVRLVVENDGPPLPAGLEDKLFESMVSARSGRDDTVHLGLGLNIVRLIAEFHGGGVHAENRPDGNGVRISINGVRVTTPSMGSE